jgi:hypothetical protein
MLDRRLIGDLAIATLLAVPTIAFSRPQQSPAEIRGTQSPIVEKAAYAERTSVEKRAEIVAPE